MSKHTGMELFRIMSAFYEHGHRIDCVERADYESRNDEKLNWITVQGEPSWNIKQYRYRVNTTKTTVVELAFLEEIEGILEEAREFSKEVMNKINDIDVDDIRSAIEKIELNLGEIETLQYTEEPDRSRLSEALNRVTGLLALTERNT